MRWKKPLHGLEAAQRAAANHQFEEAERILRGLIQDAPRERYFGGNSDARTGGAGVRRSESQVPLGGAHLLKGLGPSGRGAPQDRPDHAQRRRDLLRPRAPRLPCCAHRTGDRGSAPGDALVRGARVRRPRPGPQRSLNPGASRLQVARQWVRSSPSSCGTQPRRDEPAASVERAVDESLATTPTADRWRSHHDRRSRGERASAAGRERRKLRRFGRLQDLTPSKEDLTHFSDAQVRELSREGGGDTTLASQPFGDDIRE